MQERTLTGATLSDNNNSSEGHDHSCSQNHNDNLLNQSASEDRRVAATATAQSQQEQQQQPPCRDQNHSHNHAEADALESEAIRELIRMDLAEKEAMNARSNTASPNDTKPGAFEEMHLPKKEEELLNNVDKQINTGHIDLPPNNDGALSDDSAAIQELIRSDLATKTSKDGPVEAVGLRLRPILRPVSTSDSEDTEKSNNNNDIHDNSSVRSETVHLIEAEIVVEEKPREPVFEAQQVDEDEIERNRHCMRSIIVSSIILTLISVVVAVSLVLRFVVFKDEDNTAAQTVTISTRTSGPTSTTTPSLSSTLAPTPYNGTTWVPKGQFLYGTMKDQYLGSRTALSNDGSLLVLPSGGILDLGPSQGSFQMYRFDEMIQQWVPRGSRIMGKTASDLITTCALSGSGAVFAASSAITNGGGGRAYEWDETTNDWSERKGDITARFMSISDDGSVLATVFPQTEEQRDGALIKIQIWNETEMSWIPHSRNISIGEQLGQGGLHVIQSLSLDPSGTRFVAGANGPLDDGSTWGDSIWAYAWNGTDWTLLGSRSINLSEVSIASVDCSFECRNIAVGYWSSSVAVYTLKEDDNTWETKGQLLTGRNATDNIFGLSVEISIDGSRLAAGALRSVTAYEWLAETNTWHQLGLPLEERDPTIAEQDSYGSFPCMSGDGSTIALGALTAGFANASHTISRAGRVEVYEWPSS